MSLFAFDCDGTMDRSGGPVPTESLHTLRSLGHVVVIVSDSGACTDLWEEFQHIQGGMTSGDARTDALKQALQQYRDHRPYFYISDNPGDDERSGEAGFVYVHPSNFRL